MDRFVSSLSSRFSLYVGCLDLKKHLYQLSKHQFMSSVFLKKIIIPPIGIVSNFSNKKIFKSTLMIFRIFSQLENEKSKFFSFSSCSPILS